MRRSAFLTTALSLLVLPTLSGCASTPKGPPPFDPAGSYSYQAEAQGQRVGGQMTISGLEGSYSGQITSDMLPPISITSVEVVDNLVTVIAAGPEGELYIQMTMDGAAFTGSWSMGGMGGSFEGRKTN